MQRGYMRPSQAKCVVGSTHPARGWGLSVHVAPTAEGVWAALDGAAHLCRSCVLETGIKERFP